MSGGHWNYDGARIREYLEPIGQEWQVHQRWPRTAEAIRKLAVVLEEIEHDMDWCISGDTSIDDDSQFDRDSVGRLKACLEQLGEGK